MDFEPSKYEPEENDPEAEFRDPNSESITIPTVTVPEVSTSESDVPAEIRTTFWALVLVIKAGVIATSLGVFFLAFGMDPTIGIAFLAGGIVLFAFALRRYRSVDLAELSAVEEERGDDPPTDEADPGDATRSAGSRRRARTDDAEDAGNDR